jgi:drug/metabolite transporter (DMT)-like permease
MKARGAARFSLAGIPAARGYLAGSRAQGLALLLLTACCWGLTWPQAKFLLTQLPPFTMRAACGGAGCLLAFGLAAWRQEKLIPPRGQWPWLVVFAMLNYGAFTVFGMIGLVWLRASEAVVLTYTLPIWASLFAWPMLGERLTRLKIAALILGVAGVALLVGAGPVPGQRSDPWHHMLGIASALGAAALFGLGAVIAKRRPLAMPPISGVAWQVCIGTLPVALLTFWEQPDWAAVTPAGWLCAAYIATVSTVFGYVAWFRALRLVPASTAATTVLLSPLIGVLGSALMLGDPLGGRQVVAVALVLLGVGLAARG